MAFYVIKKISHSTFGISPDCSSIELDWLALMTVTILVFFFIKDSKTKSRIADPTPTIMTRNAPKQFLNPRAFPVRLGQT